MSTTIHDLVTAEETIYRLNEHLSGAKIELAKFEAMEAAHKERGQREHSTKEGFVDPFRTDESLIDESIARRRAKNALIGELKEALEVAAHLPCDPWY